MKTKFLFTLIIILFVQTIAIQNLFAEQKVIHGDYQIHYSVFPSNSISPKVAAIYNIKRSGHRAIVNITPQKILPNKKITGIKTTINGKARNLIGNTKTLNFQEIVEGDVIYYIAEFSFSNEESFRFNIDLTPQDSSSTIIPIKFSKKFYTE